MFPTDLTLTWSEFKRVCAATETAQVPMCVSTLSYCPDDGYLSENHLSYCPDDGYLSENHLSYCPDDGYLSENHLSYCPDDTEWWI